MVDLANTRNILFCGIFERDGLDTKWKIWKQGENSNTYYLYNPVAFFKRIRF